MKINLKRIIDKIEICLGIIIGIIFYFGKYKKAKNLQFPFIFCILLFGLVYFFDTCKLSEKDEMTSYHLVGSICLLITGTLLLFFQIVYNRSVF